MTEQSTPITEQPAPPVAPAPPAAPAKQPLPRGVMLIALLLYVAAAVMVAAASLPDTALAGTPRSALLVYGLAVAALATGLFRRRRWAWFSTMIFVLVNAYYLGLGVLTGQSQLLGLLVLAALGGYLLLPRVRTLFRVRR